MTKQLLRALLIAGISATAKAEPTVYYCEMKSFIHQKSDGTVTEYQAERFLMKVEKYRVSFGGKGYMDDSTFSLAFPFRPDVGVFRLSGEVFYDGAYAHFLEETLTFTKLDSNMGITSFVAQCDDF